MIGHEDADRVLNAFSAGDLAVLQNEISSVGYIIDQAKKKGLTVAFNPSPFNEKISSYDLSKVDYLLVNEIEGAMLTGESEPEKIAAALHEKYGSAGIVLTLGCGGSVFIGTDGNLLCCGIYKTEAVDTTAAGDTYTGFFLSEAILTGNIRAALQNAAIASGISVSRPGASPSIPDIREVLEADKDRIGEFTGFSGKV